MIAGIGVLNENGHLAAISNINQYSLVVGGAWSSDVSILRGVAGRSLAYFAFPDVSPNFSTGVPYSQASSNGWLLKDSAGNLLKNKSFDDYVGDVGSVGYQNAWITNVLAYLAARPGLDGVFVDDVILDPKALCGTYPAKYPTTATWSAAMVSCAAAVYTALAAHGYYVCVNGAAFISGDSTYNDGTSTLAWWSRLAPHCDALMNEFYDETTTLQLRAAGPAWYQQWYGWQRLIGAAQGAGKDFVGLTKSSGLNASVAVYGRASFLLEWDGGDSVYIYTPGSTDPTDPSWTADVGAPTGAKVAVGVGWKRGYTKATVILNPSPSVSQTFSVGGVSYTLAPTTARILSAVSPATAPVAAFSASPTSGFSPLLVVFTDHSTPGPSGPITAWSWDFGDGGTSILQNPTHSYSSPGTYTVRLTVTGSGTDGTDIATGTIVVSDNSPTASFTESPRSGAVPLTVTFTDTSTAGPSGPLTAWEWDFGDGSPHSFAQNPTPHPYINVGSFTVTLTVTGSGPDGTDTTDQTVAVTAQPPPTPGPPGPGPPPAPGGAGATVHVAVS